MRILITNDDGINAPGLAVLEAIAAEIGGENAEYWTVAPQTEQSGVGHSISYIHPTLMTQLGPRRFTVQGTPADCVLAALHIAMVDSPPDLILSGVNRGNNAGQNVLYSGTLGAAMEGALQNHRAIALSQYFGVANRDLPDPFEAAATHGAAAIGAILKADLWDDAGFRTFYNINFPPCPAAAVKGRKVTEQGTLEVPMHGMAVDTSPSGRQFLWITGRPQTELTAPGTDVHANLSHYVSVTPLRANLTARDRLDPLRAAVDDTASP